MSLPPILWYQRSELIFLDFFRFHSIGTCRRSSEADLLRPWDGCHDVFTAVYNEYWGVVSQSPIYLGSGIFTLSDIAEDAFRLFGSVSSLNLSQ